MTQNIPNVQHAERWRLQFSTQLSALTIFAPLMMLLSALTMRRQIG